MVTLLLLSIGLVLITKVLWDRWHKMHLLRSLGIPGPEPSFWTGNMKERHQLGLLGLIHKYTEKYGDLWGYYDGAKPTLVVADVDMLKEIFIKKFSKFHSRKPNLAQDEFQNVLDSTDLHQWKRLRSIGSPSFSAVRMKEMSPLLNVSVDNLMELFQERCEKGEAFNIHADWQTMTMETIASCAFGIETNSVKDPSSVFLQKGRQFFHSAETTSRLRSIALTLLLSLPGINRIPIVGSLLLNVLPNLRTRRWFLDTAKHMINTRRHDGSKRVDFIKLMLEANEGETQLDALEMRANEDGEEGVKVASSPRASKSLKHMTLQEMQANCFIMLIAGYETTSTALGFASYELALNPEIQKKLQEEIDQHFPEKNCRPNYLTVHKMTYLDMFVNELLRLHTIAEVASSRVCYETCQVGGYTIPAGVQLQMNLEAVHMNPDLWGPEDPAECVPERFLPERKSARHPMAWIPFGGGPRNCIGMRFALMEIKIALVRILKNFNIERCAETQVPIQKQKRVIKGPADGVRVKLTAR